MGESAVTVPQPERAGLATRLAAAAVLAPLTIAVAWIGGTVWIVSVTIVAVIALWEWSRMVDGGRLSSAAGAVIAASVAVPVGFFWDIRMAGAVVAICGGAALVIGSSARNPAHGLWMAAGAVYIAAAALALAWLRVGAASGLGAVLWLLVSVWASDALAYAAGRLIGGPRLAPRISPNKTWAGLGGAMLGAAAAGGLFGFVWTDGPGPVLLAIAGLVIGLVGQGGDLLESFSKRRFGTKDSGALIPGHGGVLDRIDALMAVTLVATFVYLAHGQEWSWSS
jgi:phosphatidate cytidylyltransferase